MDDLPLLLRYADVGAGVNRREVKVDHAALPMNSDDAVRSGLK